MIPESISKIIGFESAAHAKAMDSGVGINATKFNSYSDAATRWAEIAIGFAEWLRKNYHDGYDGTWHKITDVGVLKSCTNEELLIHYINNVFNKSS